MVKELRDLCLTCIVKHLNKFPDLQVRLPTAYKELLLERLVNHDLLTQQNLPYVIQNVFCSSLRRVVFYKCSQVDDDLLRKLAESRCQLKSISLNVCGSVTDCGVQYLTRDQQELEEIELRKIPQLTSQAVVHIRSNKLSKFILNNCTGFNSEGIKILTRNNPNLKILTITGKTGVDSEIYKHISENLNESLEELDASFHSITDECLQHLSLHCPNLRKLNLAGCTQIGKEALIKLFQGCIRLEDLDLSYCNKLRDYPGSEVLWILPQCLTDLTLCGLLLDDQTIFVEGIQRLSRLRSVHFCGVTALNDKTLEQILEKIGKNLTLLDVSGYGGYTKNLTDEGIAAISKHCFSLECLKISLLADVTGQSLLPLVQDVERASQLVNLAVNCKNTDLKVVEEIVKRCNNLTRFDLSGVTEVTNEVIFTFVNNCPTLTHISLKGCRLITDTALIEIARCCSKVKRMVLSGLNNITDASIFALANSCHLLEEIYLNGCAHVSSTAVQYLIDCCINRLYVQHATPNARPYQLMAKNLDTGEFCRADLLQVS